MRDSILPFVKATLTGLLHTQGCAYSTCLKKSQTLAVTLYVETDFSTDTVPHYIESVKALLFANFQSDGAAAKVFGHKRVSLNAISPLLSYRVLVD